MLKPFNEHELFFIDFDDTLCVRMKHEGNPDYYKRMLEGDISYYLDRDVFLLGAGCKEMLEQIKDKRVICLTWATSDIVRVAKQAFLDHYLPGCISEMIIVGTREGKVTTMDLFANVYGIKNDDIILIDDHPDTRKEAHLKGFDIMSASEIPILFCK